MPSLILCKECGREVAVTTQKTLYCSISCKHKGENRRSKVRQKLWRIRHREMHPLGTNLGEYSLIEVNGQLRVKSAIILNKMILRGMMEGNCYSP